MQKFSQVFTDRFWSHVDTTTDPDGCWPWIGSVDSDGYGDFRQSIATGKGTRKRPHMKAHRVAFELQYGPIPEGLHVLHTPPCVNRRCMRHLYVGTNDENILDMVSLGRNKACYLSGIAHPNARLSDADIAAIRAEWATGEFTRKELATKWGISRQHTSEILNNKCRR
jgi:hypothetical protein